MAARIPLDDRLSEARANLQAYYSNSIRHKHTLQTGASVLTTIIRDLRYIFRNGVVIVEILTVVLKKVTHHKGCAQYSNARLCLHVQ
ncbi:hypothetical protein KC350_g29 [Hortaea werneckii]|nr:hypothetical protein KC350_g29 [Hortaea werneckii]